MAKSQTSYATNASNNLVNQAQGLTAPVIGGFESSLGTAQNNQANQLNTSNNLISSLTGASATGGYDPNVLSGLESQTSNLAATGGFTPGQTHTLNSGGYSGAAGQGVDQALGGYSSFAQTGGFTPQQANQFLQQATEGTTDTYNTLQNQYAQSRAATGGLGTGGAAAQMARQLTQAQAQNTLGAETALNQQENANKLSGLSGLSTTAGQVAGNTLQGIESLAAEKQAGTGQELGLASNVAGNTLSGLNSAGGLSNSLYGTQTNQIGTLGNQVLGGLGLDFGTQQGAINSLVGLSKNPGALQTTLGDISSLGGAAAGLIP